MKRGPRSRLLVLSLRPSELEELRLLASRVLALWMADGVSVEEDDRSLPDMVRSAIDWMHSNLSGESDGDGEARRVMVLAAEFPRRTYAATERLVVTLTEEEHASLRWMANTIGRTMTATARFAIRYFSDLYTDEIARLRVSYKRGACGCTPSVPCIEHDGLDRKKRRLGKPVRHALGEHMRVGMRPETKRAIEDAAREAGLDASAWMRMIAVAALNRGTATPMVATAPTVAAPSGPVVAEAEESTERILEMVNVGATT